MSNTKNQRKNLKLAAYSQALEDLTSTLKKPGLQSCGKFKSTPSTRQCLPRGSRMRNNSAMCANAADTTLYKSGGFSCQDLSTAGKRKGFAEERSGLFFEVCLILNEIPPPWVVLKNVTGRLSCNDSKDFEPVIQTLADCGDVGYWRVLDSQYLGVPQARRRVFLVAVLESLPH